MAGPPKGTKPKKDPDFCPGGGMGIGSPGRHPCPYCGRRVNTYEAPYAPGGRALCLHLRIRSELDPLASGAKVG
jgi:hypothetical protein